MATANAINLNGSGIASYDGSGTFSALTSPLTVSNGGTGIASATAYGTIIGGTTGTGALQVVSPGTSTHVLTSAGAGASPAYQAAPSSSGYYLFLQTSQSNTTIADSTTYYLLQGTTTSATASSANTRRYLTSSNSIQAVYGSVQVTGTLASTESCTLAVRKNDTTNYNITTSLQLSSALNTFNITSSLGSFAVGDFIDFIFTTPAWTTNPTQITFSITAYFA